MFSTNLDSRSYNSVKNVENGARQSIVANLRRRLTKKGSLSEEEAEVEVVADKDEDSDAEDAEVKDVVVEDIVADRDEAVEEPKKENVSHIQLKPTSVS